MAPIGNSVWRFYKKNGEWEKTQYPGFAFVPLIRDHKSEIGGQKESERKTYETCEIQPRKHSRKKMLVWLGAAAAVAIGYAAYAAYVPIGIENQRVKLEIQKGDGLRIISRKLYDRGVIRSPWIFTAYTTLIGKNRLLKPGSYEFGPRVTMAEVVSRLVGGATDETIITIPEGWNLIDIGRYLEKSGLVTAKEFWDAAGLQTQKYSAAQNPLAQEFLNQFPFLAEKPKTVGLEGYLYPDTYRLYRGSSAKNIIEKMLINFNRKITPELKEKILSQDKTIFEVLTMASLLENEVRSLEDKKLVAGILWKRLSAGIPLQVDASVNYVTGKRETPSGQDIKIKSPYNTYTFPGLPTGPISNPSIESIQAALEAVPGPYLYYLSAPDGRTVYSKTLGQHEAAKAKYLNK